MTETEILEIDVEEIMKKIREEVAKRRAEAQLFDGYDTEDIYKNESELGSKNIQHVFEIKAINPEIHETVIWRIIRNTHYKLQKYSIYRVVFKVAIKFEKYIPKYKEHFLIEDFVKYHDEEFIKKAYRGILNREPDPQGFNNYLSFLRNGERNKIEILGALRYSKEGKDKHVIIKGLYFKYLINLSYRIPILGYILKLSISILRFPEILKNIQEFEAFTNARLTDIDARLTNTDARLTDTDARLTENRKNIDNLSLEVRKNHEQLVNTLSNKADIQSFNEIKGDLSNIFKKIKDNKLQILNQERRLTILLEEVNERLQEPVSTEQIIDMLKERNHLLDAMYVTFENQFRGTREEIKARLKVYLPYIESAIGGKLDTKILDVGSGRGEWLELLKENGYVAKGIDINRIMTEQCKNIGLDAIQSDVIEYLREQNQDSFGVITGFHIVEHIPYENLISLFDETLRVLKPGGIAIFETPNPENIIVGACNFYIDPTHRNPIPPMTLQFLMDARGFEKIEIMKLHPYNYVQDDNNISDVTKKLISLFNMEQDYSVIAYKG